MNKPTKEQALKIATDIVATACPNLDDVLELSRAYAAQCDELERLRATLDRAIEEVEHWGCYASPYFQERYDLQGNIELLKRALNESEQP